MRQANGNGRIWQMVLIGPLLVSGVALSCSSPDRQFGRGEAGSAGTSPDSHGGTGASSGAQSASAGRDSSRGGGGSASPDAAGSSGADDEGDGGSVDTGGNGSAAGFASGGKSGAAGNTSGGQAGVGGSPGSGGKGGSGGSPGSGGSAGTAGTPSSGGAGGDITPPTVTSVSPTGTGVLKGAAIVVKFSEPMKAASTSAVKLSSANTTLALGTGVWSANGTTLTLQPTSELEYATGEDPLTAKSFTITVQTGAQDAAGNALATAFTSSFTTLRRLQTLATMTQQSGYFDAESTYTNASSTTFNVSRQVGGSGYEDQYTHGLVGFDKSNATLTTAASTAESVALELYATTALTAASLTVKHINSSDLTNPFTTLGAPKPTTSVTIGSFGSANSWWSIDVTAIFKHPSFNLASYSSLQFLMTMEAPGSAAGVTKSVTFVGGSAATNKARLRVVRLVP